MCILLSLTRSVSFSLPKCHIGGGGVDDVYHALQYKVAALWAVRPYNHQDRGDRTSVLLLLTSLQGEFFSRYKSIYLYIYIN